MTDNEIIKALECCSSRKNCEENCPYFELKENFFECVLVSTSDAIDLIRRQQAEIKWLKDEICDIDTVNRNLIKEKAEAIKEFAEKLKENIQIIIDVSGDFELYEVIKDIDNLVKEMVGAGDEN